MSSLQKVKTYMDECLRKVCWVQFFCLFKVYFIIIMGFLYKTNFCERLSDEFN